MKIAATQGVEGGATLPPKAMRLRSLVLFVDFFLIIMAVYQIKPASRAFFLEAMGADLLPYVWIGTALTMGLFIGYYNNVVAKHSRLYVTLASCLVIIAILVASRFMLVHPTPAAVVAFYIFVDIVGVILVEQFWSLTDSLFCTDDGKRWYGIIGTGGLTGGVAGGFLAGALVKYTFLESEDLLLVAAFLVAIVCVINVAMARRGLYVGADSESVDGNLAFGWRVIFKSPYLGLIAALLLLTQLASPLVDYQFLKIVESSLTDLDARTAFLSNFFGVLGGVSIAVNLLLTPFVHKKLGIISGLLVQPIAMLVSSVFFSFKDNLYSGAGMKVSDRALSYSINKASKEMLYIPVNPVLIYQAKAWIDMFGYRLFKVLGSVVILLFTQWLPFTLSVPQFSWFTIAICILWIAVIFLLRPEYKSRVKRYERRAIAPSDSDDDPDPDLDCLRAAGQKA